MLLVSESEDRAEAFLQSLGRGSASLHSTVWRAQMPRWTPSPGPEEGLIVQLDASYGRERTDNGLVMLAEIRANTKEGAYRGPILALSFVSDVKLARTRGGSLLQTPGFATMRLPTRPEVAFAAAASMAPLTQAEWETAIRILDADELLLEFELLQHRLRGSLAVPLAALRSLRRLLADDAQSPELIERALRGLRAGWADLEPRLRSLEGRVATAIRRVGRGVSSSPEPDEFLRALSELGELARVDSSRASDRARIATLATAAATRIDAVLSVFDVEAGDDGDPRAR